MSFYERLIADTAAEREGSKQSAHSRVMARRDAPMYLDFLAQAIIT